MGTVPAGGEMIHRFGLCEKVVIMVPDVRNSGNTPYGTAIKVKIICFLHCVESVTCLLVH